MIMIMSMNIYVNYALTQLEYRAMWITCTLLTFYLQIFSDTVKPQGLAPGLSLSIILTLLSMCGTKHWE
jgi:hypothetical protein